MFLSVVIPAFNEEKRLKDTVEEVCRYLSARDYDSEIIIVDDGSSDGTFALANGLAEKSSCDIKVLKNDANRGKGFSVKKGAEVSRGDFVAFSDADLSTPIEELGKLFTVIDEGNDIVIGSRSIKGADVRIPQPWYRQLMGKTFNLLVKLLLFRGFNDTQCGFKLFRGDIARDIARKLKLEGFCFDVEMLYIAVKEARRIKEIGIVWNNSAQSRVRIIGSSLDMFLDLFRIKKLHR